VEIPFEDTVLPAYWLRVDKSGRKRPLLIIQTGLDGTAEDLYFIIATYALKRGYNCLIFEGPGQGEVIRIKKKPFRHNWETVITPVVDFALKLPEADPSQIALIGYSMGGYLVPRAMAFEHRIKYAVVDSGVFSVFDGLMTKFPAEVKTSVDKDSAEKEINRIVAGEQKKRSDIDQFINQMLWTFKADSPFQLFRKLKKYSMKDSINKIRCEMLVIGSVNDQVAGSFEQSQRFYSALKSPKTYIEFGTAEGGQFHCQIGAPMISSERILNWLDDRFARAGR
jgi:esterase/lipase